MKNYIILLMTCLLPIFMWGQEQARPFGTGPQGIIKCATVENMAYQRSLYPDMLSDAEFEAWIQEKMEDAERNGTANSRAVLTIPVIFHIIHNGESVGTGRNISAAQIQSQLDVLNEDFRRKAGTPGFNTDPAGADAEIEFCLAFWDPEGMPLAERGIERINRNDRGWTAPPYIRPLMGSSYIETTLKPESIWDPNKYFNVWVASIEIQNQGNNLLLGYAQFPTSSGLSGLNGGATSAGTDGVILRPDYCGRTGSAANNSNAGRTLTHETGHYLGLRHIWGDGGCGVDDYCSDTPASDEANNGCPVGALSCGTVDMVRNYMDYSDGTCQNTFTNCQKTRMQTVLMNSPRRASLTTSTVCVEPTTAPTSGFRLADAGNCDGIVVFEDSSENMPTQWFWTFGDGGTSTRKNPTHAYATSGNYFVTLNVVNAFGNSRFTKTISVFVSPAASINAGPDLVACAGESYTLNVSVSDPTATVRWSPSFGLLNPTSRNPVFQAINGNTYYVTATDSTGCTATDTLNITVVVKPILNAGSNVTIQPGNSINLNASMSKGASRWRWTPVYGFTNVGDDTLPKPLVMPAQTVTYTMTATDVDGCVVDDKVTVTVEGTPPLSVDKSFDEIGLINNPYPNPAQQQVMFSADFISAGNLQLSLYDLQGRKIETIFQGNVGQGNFVHSWKRANNLSNGLYFVEWQMAGRRIVQKVQFR